MSNNDQFKDKDQFKDSQNQDFKDDFNAKDEFVKEKLNFKTFDWVKSLKLIIGGASILALLSFGVYAKLQKNKENRAETGIENAVSTPIDDGSNKGNNVDNFGFERTNLDPNNNVNTGIPPEKSPEQLEYERQLAEQQMQQQLALQQAEQEEQARQQALLNARQKSGILVDSNSGNSSNSPNSNSSLAGVPPELQPLFAGMQSQGNSNNAGAGAGAGNSRISNTTAGTQGGRFDSSTQNNQAPIANASYKADRRMLIQQGKVIDAVLETSVKSDLPSNIIARITNDIYSEQGRNQLLPKGTRLFGQYSSMINDGQTEIAAVWNRAITPNGVEIMLDSPSTNRLGLAGMGGSVNNHYGRIFGTATLLSLIGAGVSNVGVNGSDQNNASQTYRTEVANSFGDQANTILQRNLSIPPTITVQHGSRIKVLVAKDLDFSTILH